MEEKEENAPKKRVGDFELMGDRPVKMIYFVAYMFGVLLFIVLLLINFMYVSKYLGYGMCIFGGIPLVATLFIFGRRVTSRTIFKMKKEEMDIFHISAFFPSFGGSLYKRVKFVDIIEIRIAKKKMTNEWFLIIHCKGEQIKMEKHVIQKQSGESGRKVVLDNAREICSFIDHLDFD